MLLLKPCAVIDLEHNFISGPQGVVHEDNEKHLLS